MSADPSKSHCPTPRRGSFTAYYNNCARLTPVACGKWACPHCGHYKAWKLRQRLEQTDANRLLTLTWRPRDNQSREDATREIKYAWGKMRRRLARYFNRPTIEYVLILEWTHRGQPHLHIMLKTPFLPQKVASTLWNEVSNSPIVDIRQITTTKGAAKYLSDYLTKDTFMPAKLRKWTCSHGYLPPQQPRIYGEDEEAPYIIHSNIPLAALADTMKAEGWNITPLGETELLATPPTGWRESHKTRIDTSDYIP